MRFIFQFALPVLVTLFVPASACRAATFAFEPFDVATGSLAGKGSGTGWAATAPFPFWGAPFGAPASVSSGSLSYADNSALTASGNKASGAGLSVRRLDPSNAVDMSSDNEYFMTFLLQRPLDPTGISEFTLITNGVFTIAAGAGSNGNARIRTWNTGGVGEAIVGTTNITDGNTYQFLVKIVSRSGPTALDEVYLNFYDTATESLPVAEPTSWYASRTFINEDQPAGGEVVFMETAAGTSLDEFGIYSEYSDIAVIPEPTSMAVLGVISGALACRRRRRPANS